MSHHPGCPKSGSMALYSECTCAAIDQREHTAQLAKYNEMDFPQLVGRVEMLESKLAQLEYKLAELTTTPP